MKTSSIQRMKPTISSKIIRTQSSRTEKPTTQGRSGIAAMTQRVAEGSVLQYFSKAIGAALPQFRFGCAKFHYSSSFLLPFFI